MKQILFLTALPCILVFFSTCKKIELTTKVTTVSVSLDVNTVAATGNIIDLSTNSHQEYGFCYGTTAKPTIASGKIVLGTAKIGVFSGTIEGLSMGQLYYVRAFCKDGDSYVYGESKTVKTNIQVVDIEGNVYNTINIGEQTWMRENLKTTKYRDGSAINDITDNASWNSQTSGAYCWYNNDIANKDTYGAMYNWFAVVDSHNLCPTGWHVPTYTEWNTLIMNRGGESYAGGQLKAKTLWNFATSGIGNNSSGFTALPGGLRSFQNSGNFIYLGSSCYFWSSTENNASTARGLFLFYASINSSYTTANKENGYSVRCIKD